jgi:hypothetical protein
MQGSCYGRELSHCMCYYYCWCCCASCVGMQLDRVTEAVVGDALLHPMLQQHLLDQRVVFLSANAFFHVRCLRAQSRGKLGMVVIAAAVAAAAAPS